MEAHQYEEQQQQYSKMEEEEKQHMANAHLSLSMHSLDDASPMMKQRKLMETKSKRSSTKKRPLNLTYKTKQDETYDESKAESSVMKRAKELLANLDPKFPTFVKFMIRSHVTVGFLLNLPRSFSDLHMPNHDTTIVLVDVSEEEYQTKYLVEKNTLSAGWRGFSIAQRLHVGDVLVFQLIKHWEFKVYIVRTNELDEVDGAIALLDLKADARQCNSGKYYGESPTGRSHQRDKNKHLKPLPPDNVEENSQENSRVELDTNPVTDPPANDKDVGLLLEEIIAEAINIGNAARAGNLFASQDDFASQGKILKAFEQLHMNVGSLHAQLNHLDSLAFEAKEVVESQKNRTRVRTEEEKRTLAEKLLKLVEAKVRLGAEMEALKANTRRLEIIFQEEINASEA